MDSFVLAETFKYLFLLFAEESDVPLNMDDFVFTTEAHLFPLSLANTNATLNRVVQDAVSHTHAHTTHTQATSHTHTHTHTTHAHTQAHFPHTRTHTHTLIHCKSYVPVPGHTLTLKTQNIN